MDRRIFARVARPDRVALPRHQPPRRNPAARTALESRGLHAQRRRNRERDRGMKLALAFIAAASLAQAGELKITLPHETGTLKPGAGIELAQANCLTCHSAEYI